MLQHTAVQAGQMSLSLQCLQQALYDKQASYKYSGRHVCTGCEVLVLRMVLTTMPSNVPAFLFALLAITFHLEWLFFTQERQLWFKWSLSSTESPFARLCTVDLLHRFMLCNVHRSAGRRKSVPLLIRPHLTSCKHKLEPESEKWKHCSWYTSDIASCRCWPGSFEDVTACPTRRCNVVAHSETSV